MTAISIHRLQVGRRPPPRGNERPLRVADAVPSIVDQAEQLGGSLRFIHRDVLLDDHYHYNASLSPSGKLLAYRSETRLNSRIAVCSVADGELGKSQVVQFPPADRRALRQSFEDPRLFLHEGAHWMSYSRALDGRARMEVAKLDGARVVEHVVPPHAGNGRRAIQKNWVCFSHDGEIFFVYQSAPFEINALRCGMRYVHEGLSWPHGIVRGGTPPVVVDDLCWSFFHSRDDHDPSGRPRYYMGAYAFDARPPFAPRRFSTRPLLCASGRDPQLARLPLVVFPCGARIKHNTWTVSLGVNDVSIALLELGQRTVEELTAPVKGAP